MVSGTLGFGSGLATNGCLVGWLVISVPFVLSSLRSERDHRNRAVLLLSPRVCHIPSAAHWAPRPVRNGTYRTYNGLVTPVKHSTRESLKKPKSGVPNEARWAAAVS
jgi:hypothetical protein